MGGVPVVPITLILGFDAVCFIIGAAAFIDVLRTPTSAFEGTSPSRRVWLILTGVSAFLGWIGLVTVAIWFAIGRRALRSRSAEVGGTPVALIVVTGVIAGAVLAFVLVLAFAFAI